MSITLSKLPSVDLLGIKCWNYSLSNNYVLFIFELPKGYYEKGHRFMLRLNQGVETIATSFAPTKGDAARLATYIDHDCGEGGSDAPYMLIIRAIHERGIRQVLAQRALDYRGLWLTEEQRRIAAGQLDKVNYSVGANQAS
jgi:hypothetical protein